jgi:ABC-2 type transport system permease protein
VGGIVGALFYLRVTSLRNSVISRVKRLKQPKYLIGAIVGIAYIYSIFLRRAPAGRPVGPRGFPQTFPVEQLPTVATLGAALLMVFVALYWFLPRSRAALSFSEAEIAFLFPAPISRRTLLHYRWINAQLRILFTSLVLALVSTGWSFLLGNAIVRILGWWLILSTLDLHAVGSSFAITRLLDRGLTSLRRQLLTAAIVAAVVAVAAIATWRTLHAPSAEDLAGPAALASYVTSLLSTGPLGWLLLPAKWVVQPLFAPHLRSFLTALGPALLLYVAHYVWVLRAEVSFEEASIAKAEKRAARRNAALRDGTPANWRTERKAKRAPFKLSAVRRPELAFLWKNLLASAPYLQPRVALIVAAVIVVGCSWLTRASLDRADLDVFRNVVAMFAMVGAGYTLVFGPLLSRQDLRLDLPNTDILKTYPLRGWQIVLGEVLAPVAIISVLLWLMLLAAALTFRPPQAAWWTAGALAPAALAVALLLPLLCTIQVLVMNAAVVLFPAWVPRGGERATGIDVLGQRIFFLAGLFLTTIVALLPAAIGAAAIFFVSVYVVGALIAGGLAVVAALAVLLVEIGLAIAWLGTRFERFDLSAELRP